ncbi:unnamed protein product [Prorocentrum cordatum]|uniref:Reverse transcriptase domain-containing protein n=1 Tax=Prorocentrum cordatum TaxID=2364126 RepID=A0ABN9XTP9_9DINO|nr:unnamed protein product [Polarella glacialis]
MASEIAPDCLEALSPRMCRVVHTVAKRKTHPSTVARIAAALHVCSILAAIVFWDSEEEFMATATGLFDEELQVHASELWQTASAEADSIVAALARIAYVARKHSAPKGNSHDESDQMDENKHRASERPGKRCRAIPAAVPLSASAADVEKSKLENALQLAFALADDVGMAQPDYGRSKKACFQRSGGQFGTDQRERLDAQVKEYYHIVWPAQWLPANRPMGKLKRMHEKHADFVPRLEVDVKSILEKEVDPLFNTFFSKQGGVQAEAESARAPVQGLTKLRERHFQLMIAYNQAAAPEFENASLTVLLEHRQWLMEKIMDVKWSPEIVRDFLKADFRTRTKWMLSWQRREFTTFKDVITHHRGQSAYLFSDAGGRKRPRGESQPRGRARSRGQGAQTPRDEQPRKASKPGGAAGASQPPAFTKENWPGLERANKKTGQPWRPFYNEATGCRKGAARPDSHERDYLGRGAKHCRAKNHRAGAGARLQGTVSDSPRAGVIEQPGRRRLMAQIGRALALGEQPRGRCFEPLIQQGCGPEAFFEQLPRLQHPAVAPPPMPAAWMQAASSMLDHLDDFRSWRETQMQPVRDAARRLTGIREQRAEKLHPYVQKANSVEHPHVICYFARVCSGILLCHYSDDMWDIEPEHAAKHSHALALEIMDLIGWRCDKSKSKPPSEHLRLLGVEHRLGLEATAWLCEATIDKLLSQIRARRATGRVTAADASTLHGSFNWVRSSLWGRRGAAVLAPLRARQRSGNFLGVNSAMLAVFRGPENALAKWAQHASNTIAPIEGVGPLLALAAWPGLGHRLWIHFIDNADAMHALIKGNSVNADLNNAMHATWKMVHRRRLHLWVEYVNAHDNPVDKASRGCVDDLYDQGGPVCDAVADAVVGALREAVEGCVGGGAAIGLVLLALLAGFAVVRYAGGDLWHERILLHPAASETAGAGLPGACWVVYTPDRDMYIEELEGGSPDDSPVEWLEMPRDLRLPSGLGRAYRFEESPTEEAMKGLYRRAFSAAHADAEARGVQLETPAAVRTAAGRDVAVQEALGANFFGGRRMTGKRPPLGLDLGGDHGGHPGTAAAAAEGIGDSGAPGPAVEGTSTPRSSGRVWRAAEADELCRIALGDELGPPAQSLCGKGLCLAAPGRAVVVHLTGLDQDSFVMSLRSGEGHPLSAGAGNGGGGDARTLTVKSGPRGRGREWREVVDACEEEPFGDFPVAGPRSAWWCLDFLRRRRTPTDHHLMFKTTARLQSEQWGVQEHEQLMKYIELAGTYDQLDLSNCAFAEAIFRRAQTIEWSYHDRLREADSASSKDKMSPEEFSAFSGFSKAGDLLMVAPTLLEFVKGQVEKDAAIMKNIRKAREERELRRKALRELRGAGVYEDIDSPVVSFDDSLVSLPEAGNVPVPLGELVAGVGDLDVEASIHEQLLPRKDAESNLSEAPRLPYMDAVLRAQPHAYAGLVRRLQAAGMVTFSAAPRERCGLFFVRKKSGKQRMVIDCRRANCWFKRPSTVALATGSALGELAVPEGEQLYVGHVDICDAFYHFGLPEAFRDYFALPAVKAGDVGLSVLGGRSLAPGSRVWPVLAVLPMGWSHALYWCQTIHRGIVSSIPALLDVPFMSDKSVAPPVQPLAMTIYVDNFLALGTDPEAVSRAVKLVNAALTSRGLRMALDCLTSKAVVSPKEVEKVLGHCTFVALLCREYLSIFRSVYAFIRRLGHCTAVPLWESVRWELNTFSSLLCLISRKLQVSWSSKVMCTDASFWGFGLVCKDLDKDLVGSMGCFSERWRFLGDNKVLSRAWAAGSDDDGIMTKPLESSKDFQQFVGDEEANNEARTRAAGRLPEAVREEGWAVVGSHKWGSPPDNIVEGEARAIAFGVKHICRSTKAFDCHHLLLSDSLSSVLALGKGRSSAPGVSGALRSVGCGALVTLVLETARLERRQAAAQAEEARSVLRIRSVPPSRATSAQSLRRPLCVALAGSPPLFKAQATPAVDVVEWRKLARGGAKLAEAETLDVPQLSTVRTQTVTSRFQQVGAEVNDWLAEQGLHTQPTLSLDGQRGIPLAPEAAAELDGRLAGRMLGQYLEGVESRPCETAEFDENPVLDRRSVLREVL